MTLVRLPLAKRTMYKKKKNTKHVGRCGAHIHLSSPAMCLWAGVRSPVLSCRPASPGCYPFYKIDPFILLECPHVYFCGNTPSFGSRIFQGKSHWGATDLGCHKGLAL